MNIDFETMAVLEEESQPESLGTFVGAPSGASTSGGERRESGKRGRKPGRKAQLDKQDMKAKLERSRQSARECRARKKLRYQYLEELVTDREKAVLTLRKELDKVLAWHVEMSQNRMSAETAASILKQFGILKDDPNPNRHEANRLEGNRLEGNRLEGNI